MTVHVAESTGEPVRGPSAAKAWLRALEMTAPIAANPGRTLPAIIDELAGRHGDAPALLSDRETLSYRELAARANRYARWALAQGLAKGDSVCLLMPNRPEYLAAWLGITRVGGVVALLNTNLTAARPPIRPTSSCRGHRHRRRRAARRLARGRASSSCDESELHAWRRVRRCRGYRPDRPRSRRYPDGHGGG